MSERDCLKEKWACLTCSTVMEAGELMAGGDKPFIYCPHCGGHDLQPVERESTTVTEYFGEIGTRN